MKIELCAMSVESIELAVKYNFDRIELCQNLEQGGITPSLGLINFAIENQIETHVLIRPRAGGFSYSEKEITVMLDDIRSCHQQGAKGVVIGALTKENEIDKEVIKRMVEVAQGMDLTFHRAFDELDDFKKGIDTLVEFGFKRILTSGLHDSAENGRETLKELVQFAENRIEIMMGGGVNAQNVKELIRFVHPDAVHFSGAISTEIDKNSIFSAKALLTNEQKVSQILKGIRV